MLQEGQMEEHESDEEENENEEANMEDEDGKCCILYCNVRLYKFNMVIEHT